MLLTATLFAGLVPASTAVAGAAGVAQSFGTHNATGSATLSASPGAATTAGDLLVATVRDRNTTATAPVSTVTDSAGNVWSRAAAITSGQAVEEIWYVAGSLSLSSSQAVTVTVGGTSAATSAISFTVLDVTGTAAAPLDVSATKSGNTQPASTGTTSTTAQASEIAIGDIGWNASVTVSGQTAGYTTTAVEQSTVSGSAAGEQAGWQLLSATGAQTYGATLSSSTVVWTGAIVTFKVGVSGTPPAITRFTPTSGADGTSVTIDGSGFSNGTSAVTFNGKAAGYTVTSDTQITTTVPAGATTGPIAVTTSGGTATSSTPFTVDAVVTGFNPTNGPVGAAVTIAGSGFTGATTVTFNGTNQPTFTVTSDSQITTSVPSGATTGPIAVTTPANTSTSSASFTVTAGTAPPHVMVIVEENKEYGSIIGNSNATYINKLAATYRSATNWYAVQHTSQNDYLELLSGSNQGLANSQIASPSATTLVDEQYAAGIPWKAYMESMPSSPCWKGTPPSDGLYESVHNPFHYFTKYTTNAGGWCSSSNLSTEGVVTYPGSSGLLTALSGTNAPDFVQISPNACNDMHGDTNTGSPCATSTTAQLVSAGDTWLSSNIGPVIQSTWFQQGGVIILTWDEGTSNLGCCGGVATGGHVATIVIASDNAGRGTFVDTGDHYGALRGIEEAYGVGLLGHSADVVSGVPINGDLRGAF